MIDVTKTREALERAAQAQSVLAGLCVEDHQPGHAAMIDADVALLRDLSAALGQAEPAWQTKGYPYDTHARLRSDDTENWLRIGARPVLILPADTTDKEVTK